MNGYLAMVVIVPILHQLFQGYLTPVMAMYQASIRLP